MRLPVAIPTWAVDPAGPLPRVGDELALQLCALERVPLPELACQVEAVAVPLEPWQSGSERCPVRLRWGQLSVHFESERPLQGPVRMRLWLHDGSHGFAPEDTPQVCAPVLGLRLLSTWKRWDEQRQTYTAAEDGPYTLDDVEEWPYAHRLDQPNPDGELTEFWEPDYLVVDLELPVS